MLVGPKAYEYKDLIITGLEKLRGTTLLRKKHWKSLLTQRYLRVYIVGAQQYN